MPRKPLLLAALLLSAALPACSAEADAGTDADEAAWNVTVYYTAVESYHSGAPRTVTGCPVLDCSDGTADLGRHPADFVRAVRDEGTGRITAGEHAGAYLNWSHDTGYWLDTAPRNSHGGTLRPYRSAAADPGVLARGTRFTVRDCGTEDDGAPLDASVCAKLREAAWTIDDEFTPGLGGDRRVDLYLGEEDRPRFTGTPAYATLNDAVLRVTARPGAPRS